MTIHCSYCGAERVNKLTCPFIFLEPYPHRYNADGKSTVEFKQV